MTILVFHQYFSTNKGSYGTRLYEFAKHWVAQGHRVIVVTSVYYKSDLNEVNRGKRFDVDGIEVIVLDVLIDNKDYFLKRVWHFLLYSFQSSYYALTLKYDLVLASSGPITTGVPGLIAKFLRGKKFVFEVRDLWPGVVDEIKVVTSRTILKISYSFEKFIYAHSDLIVALSPGMTENILRRFPKSKVTTITNSANLTLFKPNNVSNSKRNAIYTGNIGQVNNSELIIDAAKELLKRNRNDIKIIMVGDGQLYLELLGRVKMENVSNLQIKKSMPKAELIKLYETAFVSLVPLIDNRLLDTSSPNKLYESLAAGIPVIQTTQGWIKEILAKHDAGFTVSATNPNELADCLIKLFDNPDNVQRMGLNARNLAKSQFNSKALASKMLIKLLEVGS